MEKREIGQGERELQFAFQFKKDEEFKVLSEEAW